MTEAELIDLVARAEADGSDRARREAVAAADVALVASALHPRATTVGLDVLGRGVGVSPGAASGVVRHDVDAVLDAADRGEASVLVRERTTPADEPAMRRSVAVVTTHGGVASHAAVVARALGIPAVCGVEWTPEGRSVAAPGVRVTVDGSAGTVLLGGGPTASSPSLPTPVETLLTWADAVSGEFTVLANADTAADARVAFELGAAGVGLCRTEHHFVGDRSDLLPRLLLDGDATALDDIVAAQRSDFASLLDVVDERPVTVRLLDAPSHEMFAGVDSRRLGPWRESDPMLGVRGARLAIVTEGLYEAQTRALAEVVDERRRAGRRSRVSLLVPLVALDTELIAVRAAVDEVWASVLDERPRVGVMIETPRAALTAASLASNADFFSFGTNDLTQLTYGFGRDDLDRRLIRPYLDAGIIAHSPFERLDVDGVGGLMQLAVGRGRDVRADLAVTVCGEHGGDPQSLSFLRGLGVDAVSVSPRRVPAARLAAAQAVLGR